MAVSTAPPAVRPSPSAIGWSPGRMISNPLSESKQKETPKPHSPKKAKPGLVKIDTSGVTLEAMLSHLVTTLGYPALFEKTALRCFSNGTCVHM